MTRTHARAPRGQRAMCKRAPKQNNISLVGGIRSTKMCALYAYDGPVNGPRFMAFLKEHLIPSLKEGDVIVMDNLRVHHIPEVKEVLERVGARPLYLPPYSPERNPIEESWSLIKNIFRSAEARTIPQFVDAMKTAQQAITEQKISGYFKHAGYPLPA
jgi:transposase